MRTKEYMQFVECVRRHRNLGEEDALTNAIYECIEKGILQEYLQRKGSEVYNMLVAEYDYELDIKTQREEAELIGREKGIEEGKIVRNTTLIIKRMQRGMDAAWIAEDLDMQIEEVALYMRVIEKYAPFYDLEAICKELRGLIY